MRRMQRVVLLAGLVVLAPVLSACENFDMDKLDVFGLNEKKKLPGERKPVFPEGVPGVTQGIPPEYRQGNQPPADAALTTPAGPDNAAKKTAALEPEAKPKPKRKPKPRTVSQPPAARNQDQQPAPAPWPAPGQASSTAPWPSAPPPGTFSR
jgi:hypothetical protein